MSIRIKKNINDVQYGDIITIDRPVVKKVIKLEDEDIERVIKRKINRAYKNIKQPNKKLIVNKSCLNLYNQYPWIKNYKKTLVSFKSHVNKKYVNTDIQSEKWNKYTLYTPN